MEGWGARTALGRVLGRCLCILNLCQRPHLARPRSAAFDTSFRRVNPSYRPEPMRFETPSRPIESLEPAAARTGHHVVAQRRSRRSRVAPQCRAWSRLSQIRGSSVQSVGNIHGCHTGTTRVRDMNRDQTHGTTHPAAEHMPWVTQGSRMPNLRSTTIQVVSQCRRVSTLVTLSLV